MRMQRCVLLRPWYYCSFPRIIYEGLYSERLQDAGIFLFFNEMHGDKSQKTIIPSSSNCLDIVTVRIVPFFSSHFLTRFIHCTLSVGDLLISEHIIKFEVGR